MEQGPVIQFGNVWGAIFALGFFLVIAIVIGHGTGKFMLKTFVAKHWIEGIGAKLFCSICGLSLAMGILTLLYFTSLDGFYRIEPQGDTVLVHYAFPPQTKVLSRDDIARIEDLHLSGQQARLVIELQANVRLLSVRDTHEVVDRAREILLAEPAEPPEPSGRVKGVEAY